MQQPNPPLPPLAPLWDRILRARALPPDLDIQLLYVAIRDRLTHPEWEVRLHALRVLADLLPLSGNALSFPFDQVVDNLGHSSPNVRKAALDALKVFCTHCENPECAARAISDKCSYRNIRPESANIDDKVNVVTGLLLSLPSMITILKRRNPSLNVFAFFQILGEKLFDPLHKDVALRSLIKLRKACGPQAYMMLISRLDPNVQDKFRLLCETYDEDSLDVYYAQRKSDRYNNNNQQLVSANHVFSPVTTPVTLSTDISSEESFTQIPYYSNGYARVIIETEIKFDSDTAITMTVLEDNETESERNTVSEDEYDSADRNMLRFSDGESDTDVVVKKVRFGGESVKIRTPDSENQISSEDDNNQNKVVHLVNKDVVPTINENVDEVTTTPKTTDVVRKVEETKRETLNRQPKTKLIKKSGIPLPVIKSKPPVPSNVTNYNKVKIKSKSLSELYDYFRTKNGVANVKGKKGSGFELTVAEVKSPEKVPSPVEFHREVEVLHNLQRSPVVSPQRRRRTQLYLEHNGFVVNLMASSPGDQNLLTPNLSSSLRPHYAWEDFELLPQHVIEQLHNTENWIAVVKAADLLHSTLLEEDNVKKIEPAASSLVQHMWALGDAVPAARAPAEGAVCALVRSCSNDCARRLLPLLVSRLARPPSPASLPHALLHRLALHNLVDLIFDPTMIGVSGDEERVQSAQVRATLCAARAAGPAAVLAAVRRRLTGTDKADDFCSELRVRLNRPTENIRPTHTPRSSQLPVPVRRARSTPPPTAPRPPRRLRPLPDSAPLPGNSQPSRDLLKRLSPIPLSDRDSSAFTTSEDKETDKQISLESNKKSDENFFVDKGEIEISAEEDNENYPPPPRSPSIHIEDYSEKSNPSPCSAESQRNASRAESRQSSVDFGSQKSLHLSGLDFGSQKSLQNIEYETQHSRPHSKKSLASPIRSKSRSVSSSPLKSRNSSPEATSDAYEEPVFTERDVRGVLSECIVPARHEDWEIIVKALVECERLAVDPTARAPVSSWRAVARSASTHVRSLRSRVARTACCTLGSLFEHRGRSLDPELEEAATALLERSADVNRFLRADAANALVRLACGSNIARAAVALSRRGATHRAGPVRAAAAQALAKLVQYNGASKVLNMAAEPRTVFLRAAGELLGDATAEARLYGRHLCLALSEDARFQSLLKESMPPTRFRAIEKFVERLRCR